MYQFLDRKHLFWFCYSLKWDGGKNCYPPDMQIEANEGRGGVLYLLVSKLIQRRAEKEYPTLLACKLRWTMAQEERLFWERNLVFFSRNSPGLSTVIPAIDHINAHLATAAHNTRYVPSISAALALGKWTLNRYYDKTNHSEVYRIAMGTYTPSCCWLLLKVS